MKARMPLLYYETQQSINVGKLDLGSGSIRFVSGAAVAGSV
jgi:hypothetical protein